MASSLNSSSSSGSPTQINLSTRAQRRGSRTTNACEACKKRKTKCSGPPSACVACQKVDTFCHFNLRLDTRRKLAYKPSIVRERQQYILEGVLQILKHNRSEDVEDFIKLIRSDARPQELANCLKHNLHKLQGRGVIPSLDVDETDLVSLGLQGLFSHRAGRNSTKLTEEMLGSNVQVSTHDLMQKSRSLPYSTHGLNGHVGSSPSERSFDGDEHFHASGSDESRAASFATTDRSTGSFDHLSSASSSTTNMPHKQVCSTGMSIPMSDDFSPPEEKSAFRRVPKMLARPATNNQNIRHPSNFVSPQSSSPISMEQQPYFGSGVDGFHGGMQYLSMNNSGMYADGLCLDFKGKHQPMRSVDFPLQQQSSDYERMDGDPFHRDGIIRDQWNGNGWAWEANSSQR